jgi:hypothetical protein
MKTMKTTEFGNAAFAFLLAHLSFSVVNAIEPYIDDYRDVLFTGTELFAIAMYITAMFFVKRARQNNASK